MRPDTGSGPSETVPLEVGPEIRAAFDALDVARRELGEAVGRFVGRAQATAHARSETEISEALNRAWAIIEKLGPDVEYIVVRQRGMERRIDDTEMYELVCAIQDARLAVQALAAARAAKIAEAQRLDDAHEARPIRNLDAAERASSPEPSDAKVRRAMEQIAGIIRDRDLRDDIALSEIQDFLSIAGYDVPLRSYDTNDPTVYKSERVRSIEGAQLPSEPSDAARDYACEGMFVALRLLEAAADGDGRLLAGDLDHARRRLRRGLVALALRDDVRLGVVKELDVERTMLRMAGAVGRGAAPESAPGGTEK